MKGITQFSIQCNSRERNAWSDPATAESEGNSRPAGGCNKAGRGQCRHICVSAEDVMWVAIRTPCNFIVVPHEKGLFWRRVVEGRRGVCRVFSNKESKKKSGGSACFGTLVLHERRIQFSRTVPAVQVDSGIGR